MLEAAQSDVLLDEGGLLVTKGLIRHGGTSIAVRQVNAVSCEYDEIEKPKRWPGLGEVLSTPVLLVSALALTLLITAVIFRGQAGRPILLPLLLMVPAGGTLYLSWEVRKASRKKSGRDQAFQGVQFRHYRISVTTSNGTLSIYETRNDDQARRIVKAIEAALAG